jgi:hypothetical protein
MLRGMIVALAHGSRTWMLPRLSRRWRLRRFVRRMTQGIPINRSNPAVLSSIELNNTISPQLVGVALIVSVVGVESQDETVFEVNSLVLQVTMCTGAGEAQAVCIVKILEIRVDAWMCH